MRKLTTALLAVSAAGVATLASPGAAMAYDYPWCAQGRGTGIPGECSYQTFAQCEASASGRNLSCNINPRVAFNRPYRGQPYGQPYYPYPPRYPYRRSYPDPRYGYDGYGGYGYE